MTIKILLCIQAQTLHVRLSSNSLKMTVEHTLCMFVLIPMLYLQGEGKSCKRLI